MEAHDDLQHTQAKPPPALHHITNFLHFDRVQFADGGFDLRFVGAHIDNEYERVRVLDLFHRRFSRQRVLDDRVVVHPEVFLTDTYFGRLQPIDYFLMEIVALVHNKTDWINETTME